MEPHNLIKFFKETPDSLPEEKCKDLIAKLKASEDASYSLERFYEEHFKGWSAKRISNFSHNEKGYLETPTGHLISYAYAEDLQI